MRRLVIAAALLASGCYLSHSPTDGDAGTTRRDAGAPTVDAGITTACDESKLRTSGIVEPWGPGARCEELIACVGTGEAMDAARAAFPGLVCRDGLDALCVGVGPTSCSVFVGALSATQYEAACALTLRDDVGALYCAGDL